MSLFIYSNREIKHLFEFTSLFLGVRKFLFVNEKKKHTHTLLGCQLSRGNGLLRSRIKVDSIDWDEQLRLELVQ